VICAALADTGKATFKALRVGYHPLTVAKIERMLAPK
jgi:hypothetical protein